MVIVFSFGGSLISQGENLDINIKLIKDFYKLIKEIKEQCIIVVGGGKLARKYSNFDFLSDEDKGWCGISATKLNAELVRSLFKEDAYYKVLNKPMKIETNKNIISGGWKPGWTTDFVAVKFAEIYGAKKVINMSNISYVYNKDPKEKDAIKLKKLTWDKMKKIVGDTWNPSMNSPFDPIASKLASELNLEVIVLDGTNLINLKKCINNEPFKGSKISNI